MQKVTELVFYKDNEEKDWINPIIDIIEENYKTIKVYNGYNDYTYKKNNNGKWVELGEGIGNRVEFRMEFDRYEFREVEVEMI